MKVGLIPVNIGVSGLEPMLALAEKAEQVGIESLWTFEHVVVPVDYKSKYPYSADGKMGVTPETNFIDPLVALTAIAARTKRVRLGTGVNILPQTNPLYMAKQAASLDLVSNGRFMLGVGVGWLREEFEALGVPFDGRAARCREYLAAMRALWTEPVSRYEGKLLRVPPLRMFPKPIQKPHPPIVFGGESDAALRRVADLGQGWYGFNLLPDAVPSHLARLDSFLAERGRKRSEIQISISPYMQPVDFDAVRRYRDAGVEQVIVLAMGGNRDGLLARLDELAKTIVEPARTL